MSNRSQLSLDFGEEYDSENGEYILLSLKKEYYESIRNGSKKYEYRRSFKKHPTNAFIYLTSPDKLIPGYVQLGHPIINSPEEISRLAENQHRGHGKAVFDYLAGADEAFAIPIKALFEFQVPLAFEEVQKIDPHIVAPQSFIILNTRSALLKFLKERPFIKIFADESPNLQQ